MLRKNAESRRGLTKTTREPRRRGAVGTGAARERLESVALALFAERHFDSVSIRDIGKAADMNPAMIYYHFQDKESLFRAALQSAVNNAFQLFEELSRKLLDQTAAKTIDAWFDVHVMLFRQLRDVIKISVDSITLETDHISTYDPVAEFYLREGEILQAIIQRGIASGEFQSIDPQITATMISTILDGALTRTFMLEDFDLKLAIFEFKKLMKLHLLVSLPI